MKKIQFDKLYNYKGFTYYLRRKNLPNSTRIIKCWELAFTRKPVFLPIPVRMPLDVAHQGLLDLFNKRLDQVGVKRFSKKVFYPNKSTNQQVNTGLEQCLAISSLIHPTTNTDKNG